jgi:hypothetical protein
VSGDASKPLLFFFLQSRLRSVYLIPHHSRLDPGSSIPLFLPRPLIAFFSLDDHCSKLFTVHDRSIDTSYLFSFLLLFYQQFFFTLVLLKLNLNFQQQVN